MKRVADIERDTMRLVFVFLCVLVVTSISSPTKAFWVDDCDRDLEFAAEFSISSFNLENDIDGFHNMLHPRFLAVRYAKCVKAVATEAEQYDWSDHPENRELFLSEFYKTRDLLRADPAQIYAHAKSYRVDDEGMEAFLHKLFLTWAAERGHPPARHEMLTDYLESLTHDSSTTINRIALIAAEGYVPAMQDVARRYFAGDKTERDLGKAYYWIQRTIAEGGELSNTINTAAEHFFLQLNENDKQSLTGTVNYFGELPLADPRVSFHSLRQRTYTNAECESILDLRSILIPGFVEAFQQTIESPDQRIPRAYGAALAPCIDHAIQRAKGWDWKSNGANGELFIEELERIRALLNGPTANVFTTAEVHRQRDEDDLDKNIAFWLNQWAAIRGHTPAEYLEVQKNFATSTIPRTGIRLQRLANRNFVPAMKDAAHRFWQGDGVKMDRGITIYWLQRLQAIQQDTSEISDIPVARLLGQLTDAERLSLANAKTFFGTLTP